MLLNILGGHMQRSQRASIEKRAWQPAVYIGEQGAGHCKFMGKCLNSPFKKKGGRKSGNPIC